MTPQRARNSRSYSPISPSESENERGTIKLFTSRSSSSASSLASTRPEHATHASTYDGHPRNVGNSHAPQVRHTVHANVAQADAIGFPLAYAGALSCLNAGATQRSRKALLERWHVLLSAWEHREAFPSRGDGGRMGTRKLYQGRSQCKEATEKAADAPRHLTIASVTLHIHHNSTVVVIRNPNSRQRSRTPCRLRGRVGSAAPTG
jgi:hypothetical protein